MSIRGAAVSPTIAFCLSITHSPGHGGHATLSLLVLVLVLHVRHCQLEPYPRAARCGYIPSLNELVGAPWRSGNIKSSTPPPPLFPSHIDTTSNPHHLTPWSVVSTSRRRRTSPWASRMSSSGRWSTSTPSSSGSATRSSRSRSRRPSARHGRTTGGRLAGPSSSPRHSSWRDTTPLW